jgi:predicted P-loop ATPase
MEIKGSVPWEHPSKFWRDADDAQLIRYIDINYGEFSKRNYDIAVTAVADDRSYHPIREFIASLPEWDGMERVETLLIDYLGAEDNKYVRAVTRKTLCAAISRVLHPGCKFDSMLVLNGPQGVGKSTLISRLAGEWFSDSLNLGDTKDSLQPVLSTKLASPEGMNWLSFDEHKGRYVKIRLTKRMKSDASGKLFVGEVQLIGLH